jgi:adenine-specific DNA-methyltransferase
MDKTHLIQKVKSIEGLSNEERSALLAIINTKKRYGLVWEEKPEEMEELLRHKLPVLKEIAERRILGPMIQTNVVAENPILFANENNISQMPICTPNHILIEGDNLHALTALSFTHEDKIDVIYIDPPYNTGNKDFKYQDAFKDEPEFIDKEHPFRHSTWLSFIYKRLQIAQRLLKDNGLIYISIDDNEQAQLKLIADEIFTEKCHVATLPVIMNLKGNQDNYGFSDTHEYCLVYTKRFQAKEFGYFILNEEDLFNDWLEDDYGLYKKADGLRATGVNAPRNKRPNLFYPIFINPNSEKFYTTEDNISKANDDIALWPINEDGEELSWYWKKSNVNDFNYNLILTRARGGGFSIYKKQRPALGDLPTKKPKSIFYKSEYSTSSSTTELKKMFGAKVFNAPKPVPFLKDLLTISLPKNGIVLDFFAGSGTTMHATMELNKEDGGYRKCILVTNNENKICEEITYERNKKVITGYNTTNNEWVNGLKLNNLRYYKTDFIPSNKSETNRRLLTNSSTDLLCIKEDCYTDLTEANGFNIKQCRIFTNDSGKYLIIVYHSRQQIQVCEQLAEYIKTLNCLSEKIRLYGFSPEKETLTEDFIEVADKIQAVPLPEAIYNAYRASFKAIKLDKKQPVSFVEPNAEINFNEVEAEN